MVLLGFCHFENARRFTDDWGYPIYPVMSDDAELK